MNNKYTKFSEGTFYKLKVAAEILMDARSMYNTTRNSSKKKHSKDLTSAKDAVTVATTHFRNLCMEGREGV